MITALTVFLWDRVSDLDKLAFVATASLMFAIIMDILIIWNLAQGL